MKLELPMHHQTELALPKSIWVKLIAQYQQPDVRTSVWQLFTSFGPFCLLWGLMVLSLRYSYLFTLALAVPTAGFVIRMFIIQHDCGHGSFFKSRAANDVIGAIAGVFTFTPYLYWRKSHAIHHAHASNLEERGIGDVYTMTVHEYMQSSRWGKLKYRVYRHPLFLFGLAPTLLFLVLNRFPYAASKTWKQNERASVYWNNLALGTIAALLSYLIGFQAFLLIELPVIMLAASVGTWLFYVQHQFENTYWAKKPEWDYTLAALQGSSYYRLPKVLQWFTGNIGFHHIHHLSPRIPNYRLEQCHNENPLFQRVVVLTLWSSLKTTMLALWDEERKKLISFGELKRAQGSLITQRNLAHVKTWVALLAMSSLTACIAPVAPAPVTRAATGSAAITIQHEGGETTFTSVPKRVIVLEYSFVDSLFALDVQPIGYADDGVPAYLLKRLQATTAEAVGTRNEPNLEAIAHLQPDLIIADTTRHTNIYERLKQIAPTVIFDSYRGSYETQIAIFEKLGQVFQQAAKAEQVIAEARQALDAARKLATGHERAVAVGVLAPTGFTAHSNVSYMGTLLAALGLPTDLEPQKGQTQFLMDLEGLATLAPKAIVVTCAPADRGLWDEWQQKPVWQQLDAVKNHQVYVFNRDLWSKSRGLLSLHLVLRDAEESGLLTGEPRRSITCPDSVED